MYPTAVSIPIPYSSISGFGIPRSPTCMFCCVRKLCTSNRSAFKGKVRGLDPGMPRIGCGTKTTGRASGRHAAASDRITGSRVEHQDTQPISVLHRWVWTYKLAGNGRTVAQSRSGRQGYRRSRVLSVDNFRDAQHASRETPRLLD